MEEYAVKLEHISNDPSLLSDEKEVYESLAGGVGIPHVYAHGTDCEYNYMIFDLLGPSLEDLLNFCGGKFSLKTVLMLADQMLNLLEHIHAKGFIHRDIKPENFLMGTGRLGNQVYVTDLGLATEQSDRPHITHPSTVQEGRLIGTARYASINGHLGVGKASINVFCSTLLTRSIAQNRSDDLESLGYMLLYFLRGSLPWQGLKIKKTYDRDARIMEMKKETSAASLCEGQPSEFITYFNYIHGLDFNAKPIYSYLRNLLSKLFLKNGFEHDDVYDWTILKYMMATQEGPQSDQQPENG